MMSDLINAHPNILSISEFIIDVAENCSNIPAAFPREEIDGKDFWRRINVVNPEILLMVRNDVIYPEMIYPYKSLTAKFSAKTGVPAILMTMLPHLTGDHDKLHGELSVFIQSQHAAPIRWHYENLFQWLMMRLHKTVWVERSGGSMLYLEELLMLWPNAKYIHLVRDGMDTAYSMSNHAGYKLLLVIKLLLKEYLGVDPFRSDDRTNLERVPEDLKCFLPERFDRDAFLAFTSPIAQYAEVWLEQLKKGFSQLGHLPKEQLLTVSYERFCQDAESQLRKIVEFIGVDCDPDWLKRTAARVHLSGGAWRNLPQQEQEALLSNCRDGMKLLNDYVETGLVI